jgi:hypothetical protein
MTFRRFVNVAVAPAMSRLRVTDPSEVPVNIEGFYRESNVTSDEAQRVLGALTLHPDTDPSILLDQRTYWFHFDLADQPFLPCGNGLVTPSSLRHVVERVTTYVFWMVHQAHQGDVGKFTTYFGNVFEAYCLGVVSDLETTTTTVCGEIEYGPAPARRRSSDILVTSANGDHRTRIFFECRAVHPDRSVFESGDLNALGKYVSDLVGKLGQLNRSISDHLDGLFEIPGDLAGPNDSYIPVLVVDVPFQWTNHLAQVLQPRIDGLFTHLQVTAPIIIDVADLEHLAGAGERGEDLAGLLRGYLLTQQADPIDHFLSQRGLRLHPPTFTTDAWPLFASELTADLFGGTR